VSDRLALANAIEDAGIERAKAERVASVIVDLVHDSVATKADVQALGGELRAEIAATRSELKAELATQINGVRGLLASETARLDARIERLDGGVKAQPKAIMLRMGGLMVVMTGIVLALRYWLPGHG
jgi:hypothetical protein